MTWSRRIVEKGRPVGNVNHPYRQAPSYHQAEFTGLSMPLWICDYCNGAYPYSEEQMRKHICVQRNGGSVEKRPKRVLVAAESKPVVPLVKPLVTSRISSLNRGYSVIEHEKQEPQPVVQTTGDITGYATGQTTGKTDGKIFLR